MVNIIMKKRGNIFSYSIVRFSIFFFNVQSCVNTAEGILLECVCLFPTLAWHDIYTLHRTPDNTGAAKYNWHLRSTQNLIHKVQYT